MAEKIDWLDGLPPEIQEEILKDVSSSKISEEVPIEINNKVYYIDIEVQNLIDSLWRRVENLTFSDGKSED